MKSKYLIIFLMIILIFLGILWLKYNSSNKEGLDKAKASALSSDILGTVESKLSSAGVDTSDLASQIPAAMDVINKIIENESKAIDAEIGATGQGPPDYSSVVDTTGSDYYPSKSFFVGSKFSDGFCKTNSNTVELNNACSTLTAENCNLTDCCVLLQGNKCVAGNALGPTNQVNEKGDDIDYAYYSYKNQCYGSCGKSLANSANPCSAFAASDKGINQGCMKRLWSQSGCPNGAYINPDLVSSLKDNTKASIQIKFKDARKDEPNYAQCYGPNESRWPVPCNETTDTSISLSARCLKKLFKDVGCTNTDTITDTYATANELKSKSEMINTFTGFSTADDDSGGKLTKCYGSDESQWPDPCLGVSETANLLNGTMPVRCAGKIFKEATKCTSGDYIAIIKAQLNSQIATLTEEQKKAFFSNSSLMSQWTKAGIADQFSKQADEIKKNRFKCYGINPNKWDNIMGIRIVPKESDPCASLTAGMKASDVSPACKNRLKAFDIFPTSSCSTGKARKINDSVSNYINNNGSGNFMFTNLTAAENKYNRQMTKLCGPKQEYILGIGLDLKPYLKPTSDLTQPWVQYDQNSGGVRSMIQLQDGTFLAVGTNYYGYEKTSLDIEDKYTLTQSSCCVWSIVQLNDGNMIAVGLDGYLYEHKVKQIPGSAWVSSITLINGGQTIAGIGRDNIVYTRPAAITQQTWTKVPGTAAIKSLTQLKNGTFVGVGMNNELYTRPTLADANWTYIPNSGAVTFISTVNV